MIGSGGEVGKPKHVSGGLGGCHCQRLHSYQGHPPRVLNYRSSPLDSGALLSAGVKKPNRPCASSLIPAVKYSQILGPAAWSFPKRSAHKRSFWIACPLASRRRPSKRPLSTS